jgi:CDP-diacylglycerol---glycerol-3-phosphate 3-phosphatidyltransferase
VGELKRRFRAIVGDPLARALIRLGVSANAITVAGFLLNCVAGLVVASGSLALGGLLYLLFCSLDFLDGSVARLTGTGGPFGAFLDSTLDRLAEAAVLVGLVYWYGARAEPLWATAAAAAMIGSFMVSYARARAEGLGFDCEVGWLQRPERIVLLGTALVASPVAEWAPPAAVAALIAATAITTVQRIAHVARLAGAAGRESPVD